MAGLETQTTGRVLRPDAPPGCVFQQPNLLAWRNLLRNVELYAELDGMPKEQRRALTKDGLELVGLTGFEDHLPHQLSGGMQMRAALARALVTRPELLLFDEPFSAVDELLRERLQEELMRLFTDEQFAGLFITHSVLEAVFLSTRVLVMTPRPGHDRRRDRRPAAVSARSRAALRARVHRDRARGLRRHAKLLRGERGVSITDVLVEDPDAMTAAEDPHPEPSKLRHWIGVVAPPLAVAALVIGAWYFGTYVLLDAQRRFLLPPPHAVVTDAIFDGESFREILTATWQTANVAAVGLVDRVAPRDRRSPSRCRRRAGSSARCSRGPSCCRPCRSWRSCR